jgi:hypothetical protein
MFFRTKITPQNATNDFKPSHLGLMRPCLLKEKEKK